MQQTVTHVVREILWYHLNNIYHNKNKEKLVVSQSVADYTDLLPTRISDGVGTVAYHHCFFIFNNYCTYDPIDCKITYFSLHLFVYFYY